MTLAVFWMKLLCSSAPQSYWQQRYAGTKTAVLTVSAVHLVALSYVKAWYGAYKIWGLIRKDRPSVMLRVTVAYSLSFHGRTLSTVFVVQARKQL